MPARSIGPALALAACLAATATAGGARAQDPETSARAEALFKDAKTAYDAKDYATACPRFAEAQKLVRGIGVTLYLAECYAQTGRTASAWSQFKLAESLARATNDSREAVAHQRATDLEPHLAKLTVSVAAAAADTPGLAVTLDGVSVGRVELGVALPTDPGKHAVHAAAPGKVDWDGQADVPAEGSASVEVPPLADAPAPPASAPAATPPSTSSATSSATPTSTSPPPSRVPVLAWVGFGVGAAGLVVGTVTGIVAISKANAVKGECNTTAFTCPPGNSDLSTGQTMGNVSTVGFVVGGVGVAAGVVALFLLRPSPPPATGLHVEPYVGPGAAGLRGAF